MDTNVHIKTYIRIGPIHAYMRTYIHRKLIRYMLSVIAEFIPECAFVIDVDGKILPDIS
jgi:hypothetical protein